MSEPVDITALAIKMGEVGGQLKELIHLSNNNGQKLDGVFERLYGLPSAQDFKELAERVDKLESEADKQGVIKSLIANIFKSKAFGGFAFAALALYAAIKEGLFK